MCNEKTCTKCGKILEIINFYKNKDNKDGYRNDCKQCKNKYNNQYYQKYKLKIKEYNQRPEIKQYNVNKQIKYQKKYPEKIKFRWKVQDNLPPAGNGFHYHHWSYNKQHQLDVIILTISEHIRLHKLISYDKTTMMYRVKATGELLDSREKHQNYINNILLQNVA